MGIYHLQVSVWNVCSVLYFQPCGFHNWTFVNLQSSKVGVSWSVLQLTSYILNKLFLFSFYILFALKTNPHKSTLRNLSSQAKDQNPMSWSENVFSQQKTIWKCDMKNYETYNRSARMLFSNKCCSSINIKQVSNKFE